MANSKIPIIACFDVEPDPRVIEIGHYKPWVGYQYTSQFLFHLRKKLIHATASMVHYSWFFRLDDQISERYGSSTWPLETYRKIIDETVKFDDELGVRPFSYKWNEVLDDWVAVYDDLNYCNYCIHICFDTFRKFFGRECESLRMGNKWTSNATIDYAEHLGAKFDLTLEPGLDSKSHDLLESRFTGSIPDFTYVPQAPYLPSKSDFQIPDPKRTSGLWMFPLSVDRLEGFVRKVHRMGQWFYRRPYHEYVTLDFHMNPFIFKTLVNQLLRKLEHPYLAIATSVAWSTDALSFNCMKSNFDFLMSHPRSKQFVFSTPNEAFRYLGIEQNGDRRKVA